MAQYTIQWQYKENEPEELMTPPEFHQVVIDLYQRAEPTDLYYEHHDDCIWDDGEYGTRTVGEIVSFEAHTAALARKLLEDVRLHFLNQLDDVNRISLTSSADDIAERAKMIDTGQREYPEIVEFLDKVADPGSVEWSAGLDLIDVQFTIGPWSCHLGWPRTFEPEDPYGSLPIPAPGGCIHPTNGAPLTWTLSYYGLEDELESDDEVFPPMVQVHAGLDEDLTIERFLYAAHEQLVRAKILEA